MDTIKKQTRELVIELLNQCKVEENSIFLLGGSSSEVRGEHIGKSSNAEVGQVIIQEIRAVLEDNKTHLAVQCCEHLNRALVVEKSLAKQFGLKQVNALPQLNAGGSFAVAAWNSAEKPCLVESIQADIGMDIGDSFIGMHLKPVVVPVRLKASEIGQAHVTAAKTRLPLIGGERAAYQE